MKSKEMNKDITISDKILVFASVHTSEKKEIEKKENMCVFLP